MDFLYFLGRFHVVVLHVPLGILVALFVLEWLARKDKYSHLAKASPFLWGAALQEKRRQGESRAQPGRPTTPAPLGCLPLGRRRRRSFSGQRRGRPGLPGASQQHGLAEDHVQEGQGSQEGGEAP